MTARSATHARGARRAGDHLRQSIVLGTALGAWLGLLTGAVLSLFVAGAAWLSTMFGGLLIGAAAGAVVGFGNHWATGVAGARRAGSPEVQPGGDGDRELERIPLPGVGTSYAFATAGGQRIGVVVHASGRRDVVVHDPLEPDRAGHTVTLDAPEARTVAELLGLAVPVDG